MLEVTLLGQFEVVGDGERLIIPSRNAQSLLAYLLLNAGQAHRRERLAGLWWPDLDEEHARGNLRHELWRLRKLLEKSRQSYFLVDNLTIAFDDESDYSVDVHTLERAALEGSNADELAAALSVYRGELLPGFYDAWVTVERERLQAIFEAGMTRLFELLQDEGRWAETQDWANRWIAVAQWPEPAYRALITAQANSGDASKAAATYEYFARGMVRDLGIEPSAQTQALFERLQAGWEPDSSTRVPAFTRPNRRTPADEFAQHSPGRRLRRSNLPRPLTRFVGRRRELFKAAELLQRGQLVTLTGPGGSGKTRLAQELAAQELANFPDGAYFVSLASLRDPSLVAQTIANVLEVKPAKGQRNLEALQDHLAHKRALLVLDNYEHLTEAATVVSELLSAADRLRVVTTSREPLRLRGERRYPVPPLQLPAAGQGSKEEVVQVEAIQLFVLRAQDADPDFQLTDENLAAVVAICQRLDGLPLALELAAARLSAYTPALLLERLASRLEAPLRGFRDLPRRQQTLRNTIAWSYDLLDQSEQQLFARLGVFAGRWTLADAEAVCGPELPLDVADGLESLTDKSLVWLVKEGVDQPCYDMLGTIREFAVEQLQAGGEESTIVERLARHIAVLLPAAVPPDPVGADRPLWFAFLSLELDNIRSALSYFLDQGEAQPAQQIMDAVTDYWDHRLVDEGSAWLDRLLAALGDAPSAARGKALLQKGYLYLEGFDNRLAAALLEQSVGCYRECGDQKGLFDALIQLGKAYHALGDYRRRRETFDEATTIAEALGDKSALCSALFLSTLGTTDSKQACDAYRKCMALATEEGWLGRATVYKRLAAGCEIRLGNYDVGVAMLRECEAAEREMGRERDLAYVLFLLGEAEMRRGRLEEAGRILTEGLEIASGFADVDYPPYFFERFAPLAAAQGDYERAARLFGAAEAARERPSGWALNPEFRPAYEQDVAAVRAGMTEEAFNAAWARGRAMTINEATAYALSK